MADGAQLAFIAETATQELRLAVAAPVGIFRESDLDQLYLLQVWLQKCSVVIGRKAHPNLRIALSQGRRFSKEPRERNREATTFG